MTRSGSASSSERSSSTRDELAGGIVGIAQGDEPRALVDRAQHGLRPEAGDRHRAAAGAVGDGRVEAVRRPWGDELVEGLEQRLRRRAQELRGAVAHHQALLGHAEVVRQLGAQRRGVAVQVAVQPAARGVGDGVDHGRGRVLGPRRRAEVERLDAGEGLLLALVGLGAQIRADLLLGHPLELPVVAEHQCGASEEPSPPMNSSQKVKPDGPDDRRGGEHAPEDALALVVPRGPPGQDPEAIDALEQREAAEEQRRAEPAKPSRMPSDDRVGVVLDLRGDPQAERGDRPPEEQVDDDHERRARRGPRGRRRAGGADCRARAASDSASARCPVGGRRTGRRYRWDRCARPPRLGRPTKVWPVGFSVPAEGSLPLGRRIGASSVSALPVTTSWGLRGCTAPPPPGWTPARCVSS